MRTILKWWRDLSKEEKKEIMIKNNIKSMTFEQIEINYNDKFVKK